MTAPSPFRGIALRVQCRRRRLRTPELHRPNDFYHHAAILKSFAGLRGNYQIKGAIEHGAFLGGFIWDVDVQARLPAMLCPSSQRVEYLKKQTRKEAFAIGPMICYAQASERAIAALGRAVAGPTLLAFPAHSSHHVQSEFDVSGYCEVLQSHGRDFDRTVVCLGWRDVQLGRAGHYLRHGFDVVSAGHMYDPRFLPRLKAIIRLADVATSNEAGTQLGYCIASGKPFFLQGPQARPHADDPRVAERDWPDVSDAPDVRRAWRLFGEKRDDISPDQLRFVEDTWGLGEDKTSEEMAALLGHLEELYVVWKGRGSE